MRFAALSVVVALLVAVGNDAPAIAAEPSASAPASAASPAVAPASATGLDLESLRGNVVLVDFWASWCGPCAKSFPWLSGIQVRHQDDGLVVIGVNVDKDRHAADAFLQRYAPPFRIVFDPGGKLAETYDLQGMPCSFLFGRDGKRRYDHVGFRESDKPELEHEIATLLAEKPQSEEAGG